MQSAPVNIVVGSHVWVEDIDCAWIDGKIVEVIGENVEVSCSNGKMVLFSCWCLHASLNLDLLLVAFFSCNHWIFFCIFFTGFNLRNYFRLCYLQIETQIFKVYPKDAEAPLCGVDDMTKMAYLHEPGVLQNLRSGYDVNEFYVSILC